MDLDAWRREQGYFLALYTERGERPRIAAITDTVTGGGLLVLGDFRSVSDRYTYPTVAAATRALTAWLQADFDGEPAGWVRHQPSDRRRTYSEDGAYTEEVRA